MTDSTDLTNPYVEESRASAFHHMVASLFQLGSFTVGVDIATTARYSALLACVVSAGEDTLASQRGLLWEAGRLAMTLTGGNEPTVTTLGCDNPKHDHSQHAALSDFAGHALEVFFLAASVGNLVQAVNTLDALRAEAPAHGVDQDAIGGGFFSNIMTSLSMTCSKQHNPWHLFPHSYDED
jgi:hypothetical protein